MKLRFLCILLCVTALLTFTASAQTHGHMTVYIDGVARTELSGFYTGFYAKHIKLDIENNNVYVFDKWVADGVEIENETNIALGFVTPKTDVYLTTEYYLLGDIDNDNNITAIDVFYILQGMKNGVTDKLFDVNLDGVVSAADKLCLLNIIKGTYDYSELYYSLQIEGTEIMKMESIVSESAVLVVPFFAVWEGLGAQIEWESDNIVKIRFNDVYYTMSLSEGVLLRDSRNNDYNPEVDDITNYLRIPIHPHDAYYIQDGDLYLDANFVRTLFDKRCLNDPISLHIYHDERKINIGRKQ